MILSAASLLSVVLLGAPDAKSAAPLPSFFQRNSIELNANGSARLKGSPPAQGRIGGIVRQGINAARNADLASDCREAADWLAILDRELPPSSPGLAATGVGYARMMNLFRDEYFVPLMGKPYSETTPQERLQYHQRALRTCGPQQLDPQRLAIYNKYKSTTNRPFIVVTAAAEVTAAVAEIEGQLAWTKNVRQTLDRATFDQVDGYLKQAQTSLAKVWPREQQEFLNTLTQRQRALARSTLDAAMVTATAQARNGLQGARSIAALRAAHQPHLQLLDAETAAAFGKQLDSALGDALRMAAQAEKSQLAALPPGFDGVLAVNAWRRTFESEFRGFPVTPEINELLADASKRQSGLLNAAAGEFKQIAAQHPKPGRNGLNASQLLDQLFADPTTRALPEFAQYRSVLDARVQALAGTEVAENSRRAAATAGAAIVAPASSPASRPAGAAAASATAGASVAARTLCDDLAAHPDDDARAAGVTGIADEAIVAARAIAACTQAVQSAPGAARLHFQLGRAYWAAKRHADAIDALLKAEELGYAPAYFYLAEAWDYGLVEGEKADSQLATALYGLAAEGGFLPAMAMLGYDTGGAARAFDRSAFARPAFIGALYDGDLPAIFKEQRHFVLTYFLSFQSLLAENPNQYDRGCPARTDGFVTSSLENEEERETQAYVVRTALGGFADQVVVRAKNLSEASQDGVDDAYLLVTEFGGCAGEPFSKVYATLRRFVRTQPPIQPSGPPVDAFWRPVFGEWQGAIQEPIPQRTLTLYLNEFVGRGAAIRVSDGLGAEIKARLVSGSQTLTYTSTSQISFEGRLSDDKQTIEGQLTLGRQVLAVHLKRIGDIPQAR